jgi:hypothetical protein
MRLADPTCSWRLESRVRGHVHARCGGGGRKRLGAETSPAAYPTPLSAGCRFRTFVAFLDACVNGVRTGTVRVRLPVHEGGARAHQLGTACRASTNRARSSPRSMPQPPSRGFLRSAPGTTWAIHARARSANGTASPTCARSAQPAPVSRLPATVSTTGAAWSRRRGGGRVGSTCWQISTAPRQPARLRRRSDLSAWGAERVAPVCPRTTVESPARCIVGTRRGPLRWYFCNADQTFCDGTSILDGVE